MQRFETIVPKEFQAVIYRISDFWSSFMRLKQDLAESGKFGSISLKQEQGRRGLGVQFMFSNLKQKTCFSVHVWLNSVDVYPSGILSWEFKNVYGNVSESAVQSVLKSGQPVFGRFPQICRMLQQVSST